MSFFPNIFYDCFSTARTNATLSKTISSISNTHSPESNTNTCPVETINSLSQNNTSQSYHQQNTSKTDKAQIETKNIMERKKASFRIFRGYSIVSDTDAEDSLAEYCRSYRNECDNVFQEDNIDLEDSNYIDSKFNDFYNKKHNYDERISNKIEELSCNSSIKSHSACDTVESDSLSRNSVTSTNSNESYSKENNKNSDELSKLNCSDNSEMAKLQQILVEEQLRQEQVDKLISSENDNERISMGTILDSLLGLTAPNVSDSEAHSPPGASFVKQEDKVDEQMRSSSRDNSCTSDRIENVSENQEMRKKNPPPKPVRRKLSESVALTDQNLCGSDFNTNVRSETKEEQCERIPTESNNSQVKEERAIHCEVFEVKEHEFKTFSRLDSSNKTKTIIGNCSDNVGVKQKVPERPKRHFEVKKGQCESKPLPITPCRRTSVEVVKKCDKDNTVNISTALGQEKSYNSSESVTEIIPKKENNLKHSETVENKVQKPKELSNNKNVEEIPSFAQFSPEEPRIEYKLRYSYDPNTARRRPKPKEKLSQLQEKALERQKEKLESLTSSNSDIAKATSEKVEIENRASDVNDTSDVHYSGQKSSSSHESLKKSVPFSAADNTMDTKSHHSFQSSTNYATNTSPEISRTNNFEPSERDDIRGELSINHSVNIYEVSK